MRPELNRARFFGEAGVGGRHAGDVVDGIGEDFSAEPLPVVAGEVAEVAGVGGVGEARAIPHCRPQDRGQELFLIAAAGAELGDERVEKSWVCRRIGRPKVVDRIDDANAEQIPPDSVDGRAVEEGVVVGGEPVDQRRARILAGGDLQRRAEQRLGREEGARERMADLPRLADGHNLLAAGDRRGETGAAVGDAAEESGERIEVTLAIDLEGMLMALRTLQAHPQEKLADEGHDLVGGAAVAEDGCGAVAPRAPRRRQ